jgi:hypothetical protein
VVCAPGWPAAAREKRLITTVILYDRWYYDTDILIWSEQQSDLLRRVAAGEVPNALPDLCPWTLETLLAGDIAVLCA